MITKLIKDSLPEANRNYIQLMDPRTQEILNAIEWNWVNGNKGLSVPYWAQQVTNPHLERVLFALSNAGWVTVRANARMRWGEFSLNQSTLDKHLTQKEQLAYKTKVRIKKYAMRKVEDLTTDMVKTPTGYRKTGLIREGFAKCSNEAFKLDIVPLVKYYDAVLANLTKSMDKIIEKYPSIKLDETSYSVISKELLDYYIFNSDKEYNLEGNVSDSRGRAIYNALARVGNPIACKDIRACLISTKPVIITPTSSKELQDIYLFIAELAGEKHCKTWNAKKLAGLGAYNRRQLHNLDLSKAEHRKELHENIWLERIYNALDYMHENGSIVWDIPLEVDATMSLAQVVGTLTNDYRLLNRTNVINPNELLDAWFVEGVPRLHTKTVGTPVFYGSAQTATALLRKKKLKYTREQVKILNREFSKGAFGVIKAFKDFLIQHSNVTIPVIQMQIWDDTFEVEVNKFKPAGAELNAYTIWDTKSNRPVTFLNHEPILVPNYERFRLYFPTGLVHNLDSQLMNKTLLMLGDEWAIAIHDAILCMPGSKARQCYVTVLEILRKNRGTIIERYRQAIGATSTSAEVAWAKLMMITEQCPADIPFSESALK